VCPRERLQQLGRGADPTAERPDVAGDGAELVEEARLPPVRRVPDGAADDRPVELGELDAPKPEGPGPEHRGEHTPCTGLACVRVWQQPGEHRIVAERPGQRRRQLVEITRRRGSDGRRGPHATRS